MQGCVFTRDINKAILIGDALETGTVQINSAPARGPDHFPFQVNQLSIRNLPAFLLQKLPFFLYLIIISLHKKSLLAGFQGQWNRVTRNHQQHQHDDQDQDHCYQLTNPFIHNGLVKWITAN